jgi:hypothetical protein
MNYWQMMKEDVSEIRKQAQRYKLKNYFVVLKISKDDSNEKFGYNSGIGYAVSKILKKNFFVFDELDFIPATNVMALTNNNKYFLYDNTKT